MREYEPNANVLDVPYMPHVEASGKELSITHPPILISPDDLDEPEEDEDADSILSEGKRIAKDLVREIERQGRRRKLAADPTPSPVCSLEVSALVSSHGGDRPDQPSRPRRSEKMSRLTNADVQRIGQ